MSVPATPAATRFRIDDMVALNVVTTGMAPPSVTANVLPAANAAGPTATEAIAVATDRGMPAPDLTDSRRTTESQRARLWQPSRQAATAALLTTAVTTDGTPARGRARDVAMWAILRCSSGARRMSFGWDGQRNGVRSHTDQPKSDIKNSFDFEILTIHV